MSIGISVESGGALTVASGGALTARNSGISRIGIDSDGAIVVSGTVNVDYACGTFCGLRNMKKIHMWATNEKIKEFLKERFDIEYVVCYSWFTQVLGLIKPQSFSEIFTKWIMGLAGEIGGMTLSLDGKTLRSRGKMKGYAPLFDVA